MLKDNIAVKVSSVSKDFKYSSSNAGTIKRMITSFLKKSDKSNNSNIQHALRDISFEVKKGEFLGIVGRNGSGKSTLLKIIAGIYQPNKGAVHIAGKLVPFIELGVGFNPELTGRENVYLNGSLLGFSNKEVDSMYQQIVEFAELEKFMDKKLKNYSSGMQVRLAFSMAIRAKADILLIDEVLAVGDADFQRKCFSYFKKLKKEGITVILVTHDMSAVVEFCDRALLIQQSKIAFEGSTKETALRYMEMFQDTSHTQTQLSDNESTKRVGDNVIYYTTSSIPENIEQTDDNIIITAKVMATRSLDDVNLGIEISDESGKTILGTNAEINNGSLLKFSKDSTYSVTWKIPNIFEDGRYKVNLTAIYDNGLIGDWWNDAGVFYSFRQRRTPYQISPKIVLDINESNWVIE